MKSQTVYYILGTLVILAIIGYFAGWFKKTPSTSVSISESPRQVEPAYIPVPVAIEPRVVCSREFLGYDSTGKRNPRCGKSPCNVNRPGYDIYGKLNPDCGTALPPPPPPPTIAI